METSESHRNLVSSGDTPATEYTEKLADFEANVLLSSATTTRE